MKRKITNPLKNAQMKRNFQDLKDSCAFETRTLKISIITKNILFLIFLLSFQNSISQIGNVKVNVVDESENPIEGVLVGSVSNPETSGVTDSKGNVVLNMNPTGLVKLYFNEIEKMVSVNSNEVTIELKKSDKKVNVGFGQIKTVDETTTAIDLVYSDKLEKSSLLNPNESLYGKLKGLMVLQNGGEPWDRDPTMYIRGVASLNSNRILVLVDGFERFLCF